MLLLSTSQSPACQSLVKSGAPHCGGKAGLFSPGTSIRNIVPPPPQSLSYMSFNCCSVHLCSLPRAPIHIKSSFTRPGDTPRDLLWSYHIEYLSQPLCKSNPNFLSPHLQKPIHLTTFSSIPPRWQAEAGNRRIFSNSTEEMTRKRFSTRDYGLL